MTKRPGPKAGSDLQGYASVTPPSTGNPWALLTPAELVRHKRPAWHGRDRRPATVRYRHRLRPKLAHDHAGRLRSSS
jgi:hypothetical protein